SLKDFLFFQNRIEINKRDKWFVRFYSTNEDAGRSYDAVVTAFKMLDNNRELGRYYSDYSDYWNSNITPKVKNLPGYPPFVFGQPLDVDLINSILAQYNDSIVLWHQQTTNAVSSTPNVLTGESEYPDPGTTEFNDLLTSMRSTVYTDNSIDGGGSMFYDRSALYHLHGEYNYDYTIVDDMVKVKFTAGANGRLYVPNSRGTIFDEMVLKNDTVPGILIADSAIVDTTYDQIYNWEFGIYTGMQWKFVHDKLHLNLAARLDKNMNFPVLVSPAASLVYSPHKNHTIRAGFSSAIRNPTLTDQYLHYDVGRAILLGNLHGFNDLITVESFRDYLNNLGQDSVLVYFDVDPIVPEKVKTIEAGYRGFFFDHLYVDASYYYSIYDDFIGYQIGVETTFDTVIGFPQSPQAYRVATNSKETVTTQGFAIGLNYYFKNKYTISGNYSWNKLTLASDDPIIPAFNTPEHKFNVGISGRDLGKDKLGHFGFNINYKWIQGFLFEGSPQFTGFVPTYDMVDAQVSYRIPSNHITFKLGVSNLFGIQPFFEDGTASERFENAFDNRNHQVYGGPKVGRMTYFSVLFEWN
ncbi:MAG: TonB-dependent receptor, partial [Flavobacteriales bacterium]|nr:TonB-dependent receptor [Flavobacteriales bacterium]